MLTQLCSDEVAALVFQDKCRNKPTLRTRLRLDQTSCGTMRRCERRFARTKMILVSETATVFIDHTMTRMRSITSPSAINTPSFLVPSRACHVKQHANTANIQYKAIFQRLKILRSLSPFSFNNVDCLTLSMMRGPHPERWVRRWCSAKSLLVEAQLLAPRPSFIRLSCAPIQLSDENRLNLMDPSQSPFQMILYQAAAPISRVPSHKR